MNYDQFIDEILTELKLTDLDTETLSALKVSLQERIEARLIEETIKNLTPEQQQEFQVKFAGQEETNPTEIVNFLAEKLPDFMTLMAESIVAIKQEIITDMKNIDQSLASPESNQQ